MAKKQRSRKEQLAEVIRESHEQWKRLQENGGSDPFWTDGVNLNLVRNHIIYGRGLLGKYSSEKKALKVLDMIQKAYEEAEYAKNTVAVLLRIFNEAQKAERDKKILDAIRESFKETTCFQMPEDSEVEA